MMLGLFSGLEENEVQSLRGCKFWSVELCIVLEKLEMFIVESWEAEKLIPNNLQEMNKQ